MTERQYLYGTSDTVLEYICMHVTRQVLLQPATDLQVFANAGNADMLRGTPSHVYQKT